jgi:surface antigen
VTYAVNTSPAAGSIAVWPSSVGDVAYVDGVNAGGAINTEEYNWSGDGAHHTRANDNWSAYGSSTSRTCPRVDPAGASRA